MKDIPNWLNETAAKFGWEEAARQYEQYEQDMLLIREEYEKESARWQLVGLALDSLCLAG